MIETTSMGKDVHTRPNALYLFHLSRVSSGTINNKVVPKSALLDPNHCTDSAEWSTGFPGAVCDHTINFHRLALNKPLPTSLEAKDIILTNKFGKKINK